MIKSKFKRVTSLFLATLMCVTTFAGIGSTTAYAASGEKADVYMVDFPRDGDANYDGVWGHSNLTLKNGWHTGRSNFTNLKAIGSYSGNVAYCIEPGISLKVGQTMNKYDENYFNNLAANGVISGDEIRLFVGRILQYGYRGTISTSWRSQNEAAANSIAQSFTILAMVPDDEVATARKVFGAINSKTKDENTITTALDYLDKMTYVQKLNNKEDRDKAFRDVFLEEFSELFDDVDEVRTYLQNHISDSPYHWLGNKAVTAKIKTMANAKYNESGYGKAKKVIDEMPAEQVKEYLKKMIEDNFVVGLEIIKKQK